MSKKFKNAARLLVLLSPTVNLMSQCVQLKQTFTSDCSHNPPELSGAFKSTSLIRHLEARLALQGCLDSLTSGRIYLSPIIDINTSDIHRRILIFSLLFEFHAVTMATRRSTVSVAVDPVALITTECITITSAMRKHARWAHSSVSAILGGNSSPLNPNSHASRPSTPRSEPATRKGIKSRPSGAPDEDDGGLANRWGLRGKKGKSMQDNPLIAGFGRLRRELTGCKGSAVYMLSQ